MVRKLAVAGALLAAACSSTATHHAPPRSTEGAPVSPAGSTSRPDQPALVGVWQRTQKCAELAGLLDAAGMKQAIPDMVAGDGWVPGVDKVSELADTSHPCAGAVARRHSHFFTVDGKFGSLDAAGQQVDDGQYRIVDDHTFAIGTEAGREVRFHYRVVDGDTISFTPVIPRCRPSCFDAIWSVSVAYQGYTWHRVG